MAEKLTVQYDFIVCGAGIAGICAAIQAGRLGLKTALIEKEMFLGGNGGQNLGVPWHGAATGNPYWKECGIIEELQNYLDKQLEQSGKIFGNVNPMLDPMLDYYISRKIEDAGATIYRRHMATEAKVEADLISSLHVLNIENGEFIDMAASGYVLDSTGDAHVAYLAGAESRIGRESKNETGERSAPENHDDIVSAASITAVTVDTGVKNKFVLPSNIPKWNPEKPANSFNPDRKINFLFQVDEGGECPRKHPLYSPQDLYGKLYERILSLWDYFKNTLYPKHAGTHQLFWISPILGRRESRRIIGDYILTQTDIESNRKFSDAIAFGGFALDFHPPSEDGGYECVMYSAPLPYDIPYRCIYSKNIKNLFTAGRNISATHLAFYSTRVQRTGGTLGQVAAIAAYLCRQKNCTPAELGRNYIDQLQREILKNDGWIIGIRNSDQNDLALSAKITAGSEASLSLCPSSGRWLNAVAGLNMALYQYPARINGLMFNVHNPAPENRELKLSLLFGQSRPPQKFDPEWPRTKPYNFFHPVQDAYISEFELKEERRIVVPAQFKGWLDCGESDVEFPLPDRNTFLKAVLLSVEGDIDVMVSDKYLEFIMPYQTDDSFKWKPAGENVPCPCFKITPDPVPGKAENIIDGVIHREGLAIPHQWISAPGKDTPQWVRLDFSEKTRFNRVIIRFDSDESREKPLGRCVADYCLEYLKDDVWGVLLDIYGNASRVNDHKFDKTISAEALRIICKRVINHAEPARIYEIRIYNEVKD